jgi:hypothetical protein
MPSQSMTRHPASGMWLKSGYTNWKAAAARRNPQE